METTEKDIVIQKVLELSPEQTEKVLIFMAGLEAGNTVETKTDKIVFENKGE